MPTAESNYREFHLSVRVYIEDTDAGGIVYYINYLKFMERARTEFMRSLGFDKQVIFESNQMFVVHSSQTRYILPAKLDDELEVSANVLKVRKASILFEQIVRRNDEEICRAEIKVACVDKQTLKPSAMPSNMQVVLKTLSQ